MQFKDKNAVICGAGGAVGREGASVLPAARTRAAPGVVAAEISAAGDAAATVQDDAPGERAIEERIGAVAARAWPRRGQG